MDWSRIRRCTACGAGCPEDADTCIRCGSAALGEAQSPWSGERWSLRYIYRPIPYPPCPVVGPTRPVLSGHLSVSFLLPKKCVNCDLEFEGDCMRANERWPVPWQQLQNMTKLHFIVVPHDFEPCTVPSIDELSFQHCAEETLTEHWPIPVKCTRCDLLSEHFRCSRYLDTFGLTCPLDFSGIDEETLRASIDRP
jgi:hypothetical protein